MSEETWRVQSIHHWRHWDFWASRLTLYGASGLLTSGFVYAVTHLERYVTVGDVLLATLAMFAAFVAAMLGAWWTDHTYEKYKHELPQD